MIKIIAQYQQPAGNFLDYSSPSETNNRDIKELETTFFTSLILSCLSIIDNPISNSIKDKGLRFLLNQANEDWSFNYWTRNSTYTHSYPDDLDDTFCALAAIKRIDSNLLDSAALAKITTLLTNTEAKIGGPYYTWILPNSTDKRWKDIDYVVNSNIAYFLSLHTIRLPNIEKLIDKAIKNQSFVSPYYPSEYPVIYFISRVYKGKNNKQFISYVVSAAKKLDTNDILPIALATTSLLNLAAPRKDIDPLYKKLLGAIRQDNYPWSPFCLDPVLNNEQHYGGSTALTAAFVAEAVSSYEQRFNEAVQATDHNSQRIINAVLGVVEERVSKLPSPLRIEFRKLVKDTLTHDPKNQIILLPYLFSQSIASKIPDSLLVELGTANLWGWLAYTIYDNFLDNEAVPNTLPHANIAFRELITVYNKLAIPGLPRQFQTIIDRIEVANYWETSHCRLKVEGNSITIGKRLPSFTKIERLSDRSIGHALGPVAILLATENQHMIDKTFKIFGNYLAAKQLNDDAHDWKDDLRKGRLTSSTTPLIKTLSPKVYALDDLIPKLERKFWQVSVKEVGERAISLTDESLRSLEEESLFSYKEPIRAFLESVRKVSVTALKKREQTLKFLEAYKNQSTPQR